MRKLVFAINISLDGCCEHTKFYPDEDTYSYMTQLIRDAGTFLYGRKTYELMVPYWPDVANDPSGQGNPDYEFAQAFVSVDNMVVFSRSLDRSEDKKTRIIDTNLRDEVLKLKQEDGKNIFTGGITLASQLAELGLIDEYHLLVHSLIVGEGRRLFDGISLQEKLKLKLVDSTIFKSGTIALRYVI